MESPSLKRLKSSTQKSSRSLRFRECVRMCFVGCCSVLQCVAVSSRFRESVWVCFVGCCRVLHCVAVCCSVLHCVAVCCSVLWYVALQHTPTTNSTWKVDAMSWISAAFRFVWWSLQHAATRCNTLQHAATRCNTLQHAATYTYL